MYKIYKIPRYTYQDIRYQDIDKKKFYSKLKTTKKVNGREYLELIRRFLSNSCVHLQSLARKI